MREWFTESEMSIVIHHYPTILLTRELASYIDLNVGL